MPLLGQAAMLLSFDVAAEAVVEHDDWHTHEHLPERLSIPGFMRGKRWIAIKGHPRYVVLYEVTKLATLNSDAYLQRLNNSTPWTSKMIPHYRGITRGLSSVTGSFGLGVGHLGLMLRFSAQTSSEADLCRWLIEDTLPQIPMNSGIGSVHLLEGALRAPMTSEQRIRGADADVDWAIFVTGYRQDALAQLASGELRAMRLTDHGAVEIRSATYRMDYSLSHQEIQI